MMHITHRSALILLIFVLSSIVPSFNRHVWADDFPVTHTEQDRQELSVADGSVMFIENVGQFPPEVRFQMRSADRLLWLTDDALWVTLLAPGTRPDAEMERRLPRAFPVEEAAPASRQGVHLKLSFVGANPYARLQPIGQLETKVSYFIGNDPEQWQPDVPVWGGVRYVDLYPGLDLEVIGAEGRWSWRLAAGGISSASLSAVTLQVEGAEGLALSEDALRLTTAAGEYSLPLMQGLDGTGTLAAPALVNNQVYQPFAHTARASLPAPRADSELTYATFLGGSGEDWGRSIAIDGSGAAYVTGWTPSSDFPTTPGAFDMTHGGGTCGIPPSYPCNDVFVVKLNPNGSGLAYATFLSGSNDELGYAIAVDGSGAAYITGVTASSDFPVTPDAFDTIHDGDADIFVVKLNPNGTGLAYSTRMGGSSSEVGYGIAVDGNGAAYITGWTWGELPVTSEAFDTTLNGNRDAFVVKINPSGTELIYATYLGGRYDEIGYSIAVDGADAAYVTGETGSYDFPSTPEAFDTYYDGPYMDAFIVKLNPTGSDLVYATFLGGRQGNELGLSIAVDEWGMAYVTGGTTSSDFPTTTEAFDTTYNGYGNNIFIVKIHPLGTELIYATFLGGKDDSGYSIIVDKMGAAYVSGGTGSSDFPTTTDAIDTIYEGSTESFIAKLSPQGTALDYATFLGGSKDEWGYGIGIDKDGSVYAVGMTSSIDFPTTPGAFDTSHNGDYDIFVVKLGITAHNPMIFSGRITDSHNQALPGVTVRAGNTYSTTTSVGGYYSFSDLPPGEYPLTAVKEGWAFSTGVASRRYRVTIPQETPQSYDYVAVRTPVVFVPGVAGSQLDVQGTTPPWKNLWPALFTLDKSQLSLRPGQQHPTIRASDVIRAVAGEMIYAPLLTFLTDPNQGGYTEHSLLVMGSGAPDCGTSLSNSISKFPNLFVFPYDWRKSNKVSAQSLKNYVDCIQSYYPDSQINIVAHSMGGLVARRYILNNQQHHVNKLITIGTPWLGAPKMLNVLENGDFFDGMLKHMVIISKRQLRTLVAHFPGAHELSPSRMYCELNGKTCPFEERGWDVNGQNGDRETYDYDALVNMLNSRYPLDRQDGDTTKPGSNGQTFHERVGQDDWSQVPTGVEYHYIYGIQATRKTISHIAATTKKQCAPRGAGRCSTVPVFKLEFDRGDKTVPLISARRARLGQQPNGSNITLHEVRSTGEDYDEQAEHLEMIHSKQVQECLLKILNGETCPAVIMVGAVGNAAASDELLTVEPAYYLTVVGAEWATATDSAGNVTGVISDTYIIETIPNSSYYPLGERSFMFILPTDEVYTTTFRSGEIPLFIELTREGETVTQAVRYQDLELPPNVTTTLTLTPQGLQPLRYDSTGDGIAETEVQPTISVTGPLAADTMPPTVTVSTTFQSAGVQVTITAVDDTAVARTYFSLDGQQYQEYTAPFLVNVAQSPLIYVFADDTLANRSSLLTWRLGYGLFLPVIENRVSSK